VEYACINTMPEKQLTIADKVPPKDAIGEAKLIAEKTASCVLSDNSLKELVAITKAAEANDAMITGGSTKWSKKKK